MIISASRRTDIPAHFSSWFFNRLEVGFCMVRNPLIRQKVTKIPLIKGRLEGIVFWTKNPGPMLGKLGSLKDIPYYFQFTLTSYSKDIEKNLPGPNKGTLINTFYRLAKEAGAERVIWRYDPVLISGKYSLEWHQKYFAFLCERLAGHTERCVFSFLDHYSTFKDTMEKVGFRAPDLGEQRILAASFAESANRYGLTLASCAESIDLGEYGITHSKCIDAELLERLGGIEISATKDLGQRIACGCAKSMDIGVYSTCRNGCVYCYAMKNEVANMHDPQSSFLVGGSEPGDEVIEANAPKVRQAQASLFDFRM